MSESTPTSAKPPKPRTRGVALALTLVVVAVAAFAAAIVWAGGIDAAAKLAGIDLGGTETVASDPGTTGQSGDGDSDDTTTTPGVSTPATSAATATPTAPPASVAGAGDNDADDADGTSGPAASATIPISAAQAKMYREQLQSQGQIIKLVDGEVSSIAIGTAAASATQANIPLSVSYKASSPVSGTMTLLNTGGLWYFSSISAGGGNAAASKPQSIDSGVVSTITQQQADPDCQALIEEGLVEGGFDSARVDGVSKGAGTATVNVTLQGGTLDRKAARFVLISKTDSGNKYWFLTRFELK